MSKLLLSTHTYTPASICVCVLYWFVHLFWFLMFLYSLLLSDSDILLLIAWWCYQESNFEFQVRQEISPIVLTVISCLVPILQHAEVISFSIIIVTCTLEEVSSFNCISWCRAGAQQQVANWKQCYHTWEACVGLSRACGSAYGAFYAILVHCFVNVSFIHLHLK